MFYLKQISLHHYVSPTQKVSVCFLFSLTLSDYDARRTFTLLCLSRRGSGSTDSQRWPGEYSPNSFHQTSRLSLCIVSHSFSVWLHRFEIIKWCGMFLSLPARFSPLAFLSFPLHLILCLDLSRSLSATFIWVLSSLKVTLLIQILIMNGRESGLRYGHLRVFYCVSARCVSV